MTNHPNRNWRQRMLAAADQWLETTMAKALIEIPLDSRRAVDGLRNRIREAYLAGYEDGRKRDE